MSERLSDSAARRRHLEALDFEDPLAPLRDRFLLPEGVIYLDGNSLGPLPRAVVDRLHWVVEKEWREGLIRSWNSCEEGGAGWIDLARRVAGKIAPLLGTEGDQVLVADSTSVNLYKLLLAGLEAHPTGRRVILTEERQFPNDLYLAQEIAQSQAAVELRTMPRDAIEEVLANGDHEVALLYLTHVDFRSGEIHDMPRLTRLAHEGGALVLWDLAHSAGAVPLDLNAWGVDLAVGCGYKFLNGGPGAPAFLYVARRWQGALRNPIAGWLGHREPFAFDPLYQPAPGIDRFTSGTPPILSLAALDAALDVFNGVSTEALHHKALELGDLFLDEVARRCAGHGLEPACPGSGQPRGSQVAFRHPEGHAMIQALIDCGVIGDFRAPDILRFGLAPLYLRRVDIFDAARALGEILDQGSWLDERYRRRGKVT